MPCSFVSTLEVVVQTGEKFWSTKDPGQEPFTYDAGLSAMVSDEAGLSTIARNLVL